MSEMYSGVTYFRGYKTEFIFKNMIIMQLNKKVAVVGGVLFVLILIVLFKKSSIFSFHHESELKWMSLSATNEYTQDWTQQRCLKDRVEFRIKNLAVIQDQWKLSTDSSCVQLYQKFSTIYFIEKTPAPLVLPESFQVKVRKWLKNNEELFKEVYKQEVTQVVNEWTKENTIFNPLREKRPISKPTEPEKTYVKRLVEETAKNCDFCNYKEFTAADVFGRLESKYSFSASNAFKLGKYHELFALKTHDPHNWNLTQFMDMMNLTLKWFDAAHRDDSSFNCPEVIWDILPRAGASQVHPHMHGLLGKTRYHGETDKLKQAAIEYERKTGSDYFTDLINVHSALGLVVHHKDAVALANLTPKKDHEVIIIARKPTLAFYKMIYFVMRAYIDDLEKLATSMGIGLPPLDGSSSLPAFARIVTRGAVAEIRSDISSLELFSAVNVNIDPFKVIQVVKQSIEKRS
ncbi:hypothetical protein LOTGIDRAFT_234020 [Lottia gigantea]|uniref:Uncharacterized protein n=1 Tax=Lottia gigantea TaxID=225164 RepID=V4A9C8_LOTGI|nr:hypothetical protein LOTGIDRAFT_234020 [Lottia gigantea]ESO89881.1 hypothetical protein LOTGIDRAFT_234020 [Lottia gigantea]